MASSITWAGEGFDVDSGSLKRAKGEEDETGGFLFAGCGTGCLIFLSPLSPLENGRTKRGTKKGETRV